MKKLLLIALTLITNFVSAQTFTKYVDNAQKAGFAYNVTFQLTLKRMATKSTVSSAANGTEYSVRLVSVEVDQNKGWNQLEGWNKYKTYSCSQLNGICNTKTFDRITSNFLFDCVGKELTGGGATFYNIGDEKIMILQPKAVGSNVCASPTVSDIGNVTITEVSVTNTILSIIQKLDQNNSNTSTQNTNTGNQSNTNQSTKQIPDDYKGNPLHYNNPNISSGSNAADDFNKRYQQGQQIAEIAIGVAKLLTPSPEKEKERQNFLNSQIENNTILAENIIVEFETDFKKYVKPYLEDAEKGNTEAQIVLFKIKKNWFITQREKDYFGRIYSLFYYENCSLCEQKSHYYFEQLTKKFEEILPQKKVDDWNENLASKNNKEAMFLLAKEYDKNAYSAKTVDEKKEYKLKSFKLYKSLADAGDVKSMYALHFNINCPWEEAMEYELKAAEGNCYKAMYRLGYMNGYNGKKYDIAFKWLDRIVNTDNLITGDYCGYFNDYDKKNVYEALAKMYKKGLGTPKNETKSNEYYLLYKKLKNK